MREEIGKVDLTTEEERGECRVNKQKNLPTFLKTVVKSWIYFEFVRSKKVQGHKNKDVALCQNTFAE